MDTGTALQIAHQIVEASGHRVTHLETSNILDYIGLTVDLIKEWPKEKRDRASKLNEFLIALKRLEDNAEQIIAADPAVLYRPAHRVSEAFHKSQATYRYLYSANRASKTTSANIEAYRHATGNHPFRKLPPPPYAVFQIGPNFTKYAPNVFEKKMITGEAGNPLSPLFPKGGKWLYKYDERKHILYIACKDCAEAGRAESCSHPKSTYTLYSDVEGPEVLAGAQFLFGHLDEQISKAIFNEAAERIKTVPGGNIVMTETPLGGLAFWTYELMYLQSLKKRPENWDPVNECPVIESFTIDQYEAGLVPHHEIEKSKIGMTEAEIQVRIHGKFVSALENAVFDHDTLYKMDESVRDPLLQGFLMFGEEAKSGKRASEILELQDLNQTLATYKDPDGHFLMWEPPKFGSQYVIGSDVAFGLTKRDPSAAIVAKMTRKGFDIRFEVVAMMRGWFDTLTYAAELFKLGMYYRWAELVIESNGPGLAVIQFLNEKFMYPKLFQDATNKASSVLAPSSDIGVNTNLRSKGMMLGMLKSVVALDKRGDPMISIPSRQVVEELKSYVQEDLPSGGARFAAAGISHDDLVIALMMLVYAGTTFPIYDADKARTEYLLSQTKAREDNLEPHEKQLWEMAKAQEEERAREQREIEQETYYE